MNYRAIRLCLGTLRGEMFDPRQIKLFEIWQSKGCLLKQSKNVDEEQSKFSTSNGAQKAKQTKEGSFNISANIEE